MDKEKKNIQMDQYIPDNINLEKKMDRDTMNGLTVLITKEIGKIISTKVTGLIIGSMEENTKANGSMEKLRESVSIKRKMGNCILESFIKIKNKALEYK